MNAWDLGFLAYVAVASILCLSQRKRIDRWQARRDAAIRAEAERKLARAINRWL